MLDRLVKCLTQEAFAEPPFFEPPIDKSTKLYEQWAQGKLRTGDTISSWFTECRDAHRN
jgi:hypothetical protein